jgi:hypothetical protein
MRATNRLMADILETRCVSENFVGSEHVVRVACIGDSLMYGAGVAPRESLPAQLSRTLNAAFVDDLVWVDNFGENSGNIWHAWSQFAERLQHGRFDAVVFSICDNDIALFESNTVAYGDAAYPSLWLKDAVYSNGVFNLFKSAKDILSSSPIIPLFVFYTLSDDDRPITDCVAHLCGLLDLPFIDLRAYLTERTAITRSNLFASEFDGHPSAIVHDAVARGIAERLREASGLSHGRFGADPERVLAAALDDLLTQGVAPDAALSWATEALAAKQRAAGRSQDQARAGKAAALEALSHKMRVSGDRWRLRRRLEARVPPADQIGSLLVPNLVQLYHLTRNLDELIFVLTKTRDAPDLAAFGRLFAQGHYVAERRLDFYRGDAAAEAAAIAAALPALPFVGRLRQLCDGTGEDAGPHLSPDCGLAHASLPPEIVRLGQFASRLHKQLERLSEAWAGRPAGGEGDDIARLWAVTCVMIRDARDYLDNCEAVFGRGPDLAAPIPPPWTSIDVVIEGTADPAADERLYRLGVEASYAVPRRMPIREVHWGDADRARIAHHFEIPALLRGDIRVGLTESDPTLERFLRGATRIAEIRIASGVPGNALPPAVEWRNSGQNLSAVSFSDVALA